MNQVEQFLPFFVEYANWLTLGVGTVLTILSLFFSKKHHSEQLRSYVPTIWTSLGIFFTFLSIYVTLKDYAALPDDKISMGGIIKGIIPAFSTSVIGILFAILTAYYDRWEKSRGEASDNTGFERFSKGETSDKGDAQTPDIILLELVREIKNLIATTHKRIDSLSENITSNINCNLATVSDNLLTHKVETIACFKDTLEKQNSQLRNHIESFVTQSNTAHEKRISEILRNFTIDSKERETKHRDEINDLMKFAKDHIDLIKDNLCKESAERQEDIKNFILKESDNRRSFVEGQNNELTSTLNLARESINKAVNDITNLFESQIKQNIEDFAKIQYENCVGMINSEFKAFQENSEKVLATQESESADFLRHLSGSLKEAHSSIVTDISHLKEMIVHHLNYLFDENRENIKSILRQHVDDFSSIAQSIQETFETERYFVRTASQEMKSNHATILDKYKEEIFKTASLISNSAGAMSDSLLKLCTDLQHKTEKLGDKHVETIEGIIHAGETSMTKLLESQSEKIDIAIEMYKGELEGLSTTISGTGQKMAEEMELFCSNLNTRTESLEREHFKRVENIHIKGEEKIKEANEKLENEVSSLINTIQQLRTSVQSSSNDFVAKHDEIKKQITDTTIQLIYEISRVANDSTQIKTLERTCERIDEQLNKTIDALDKKYQTITDSLKSVATSIDAFSRVANDTETLNKFVLATIELYKTHSTKMTFLEDNLKEMTNTIISAVASVKESSSIGYRQEVKQASYPKKK